MNISQLSYNKLLGIQYLLNQRPRKSLLFEFPLSLFITLTVESTNRLFSQFIQVNEIFYMINMLQRYSIFVILPNIQTRVHYNSLRGYLPFFIVFDYRRINRQCSYKQ